MTSVDSEENQKLSVELATDDISNLESSVMKITEKLEQDGNGTLDNWIREHDRAPFESVQENISPNIMKCPGD